MTDQIILNADERERTGSNKARVIRKIDGMVPAIVYGDEKETINIKLKLNELTKASENELFYTQVLLIKTGDEEEKVVLKELQKDPAKGKFLHADFQRVSRKSKLKVVIPVNFINEEECIGLKEGGILNTVRYEVELACSATNIPDNVEIDLTNFDVGDAIKLSDAKLPEGATSAVDRDITIATIAAPRALVEETDEEAEGEEGAETAEGEEGEGSAEGEEGAEKAEGGDE